MPETWIPVGALFAAVGAFTLARPTPPGPADAALPARARTWLGWTYLVVGAVVLLNGVAAIGAWWTVGALAAGAVLATTGAFLLRWPADLAASAIGAAHGLAASVAAAAILEPSAAESATTAALACGALVAAAAAAQWLLPRERLAITGPWAALGLCGLLITAVWAGSEPSYGVARLRGVRHRGRARTGLRRARPGRDPPAGARPVACSRPAAGRRHPVRMAGLRGQRRRGRRDDAGRRGRRRLGRRLWLGPQARRPVGRPGPDPRARPLVRGRAPRRGRPRPVGAGARDRRRADRGRRPDRARAARSSPPRPHRRTPLGCSSSRPT